MAVRLARGQAEIDAALALRERVFCGEQGVTPDAERDGRDPGALHVVAIEDGELVGTCRVLLRDDAALLGRLAVRRDRRRRGIARAIVREAERRARGAGAAHIELHAQLPARDLYAQTGFVEVGEVFIEEGIDHVAMEKRLA